MIKRLPEAILFTPQGHKSSFALLRLISQHFFVVMVEWDILLTLTTVAITHWIFSKDCDTSHLIKVISSFFHDNGYQLWTIFPIVEIWMDWQTLEIFYRAMTPKIDHSASLALKDQLIFSKLRRILLWLTVYLFLDTDECVSELHFRKDQLKR